MPRTHVVEHPLIAHYLTRIRDHSTPSPRFRELVGQVGSLLAYEATRDLELTDLLVEEMVFVDDLVTFQAQLKASGMQGQAARVVLRARSNERGTRDVLGQPDDHAVQRGARRDSR